jgi:hypothetical protein
VRQTPSDRPRLKKARLGCGKPEAMQICRTGTRRETDATPAGPDLRTFGKWCVESGAPPNGCAILWKHRPPRSRDGGTGRRSGLKIRRSQGRGGSTPPPGTNKINKIRNTDILGCLFLCPNYDQSQISCFPHLQWTAWSKTRFAWLALFQIVDFTPGNRKSTVDVWGLISRASRSQAAEPLL